jgi:ATP-dependent helicase/nuclease subunit B
VLSARAWLMRCWSQAGSSDDRGALPLIPSVTQDYALWERVVLSDADMRLLLQPFGAMRAARRAWQLAHDWNIRLPGDDEGASEEAATFARWGVAYSRELERYGWLDAARAVWRLGELQGLNLPQEILLAGFAVPTPAYRYLGERLATRGVQVAWLAGDNDISGARQCPLPDASSELESAARWALDELQVRPHSQLLVVIPDLEQRRAEVERLFSRALLPASALMETAQRPAPFVIEGGTSLGDSPLVAAALTALKLASGELPFEVASDWLRSPFLGGSVQALVLRARIDVRWRRTAAPKVTLWHIIQALNGSHGGLVDADLAQALGRFAETLRLARSTLSHWSDAFASALRELGWPGTETLKQSELATLQAFNDALAELATLDGIAEAVTLQSAVNTLSSLVARTRLQERPRANGLTISGRLADPCIRYDGIWICGLHAAEWPGPALPDPFIPQPLQAAAGVPESTAGGTLELARRITNSLLSAAPRVIVSWPRRLVDATAQVSPLVESLPGLAPDETQRAGSPYLRQVFDSRALETLCDEQAPAIPTPAKLRGGASALHRQSLCPFRSFAQHRLRAEPLERPLPGIDPRTRGSLVHRALDSLWSGLKDQVTLLRQSPEERGAAIDAAIAAARGEVFGHSDRWPARLVDLECARLDALLRRWLEVESQRTPFRVLGVEQRQEWSQAGLTFTLRIDRIDQLEDGRTLLLDYKTGEADAKSWFGDRPEEPQMLLYATALDPAPGALSFGLLNAEGCSFDGLSSHPAALPKLNTVSDWGAQLAIWHKVLARLAQAFARGDARVDPLSRQACDRCHLHTLCRIDEVRAQRWTATNG